MAGLEQEGARKVFVIVAREVLIGQDLREMIELSRPDADTVLGRSAGECAAMLLPGRSVDIAFVDISPALYENSLLAGIVEDGGGSVVFLGQDGFRMAQVSSNWAVLSYPFSEADVRQLLTAHQV